MRGGGGLSSHLDSHGKLSSSVTLEFNINNDFKSSKLLRNYLNTMIFKELFNTNTCRPIEPVMNGMYE